MAQISFRRLRQDRWVRELIQEVRPSHKQMIQPYFVVEGLKEREAIPGLPGVYRETLESLQRQISKDMENGVRKIILFGVPQIKAKSNFQFDFHGNVIHSIQKEFGSDLWIATDVCVCSYTDHGQCGVVTPEGNHVDNLATVKELVQASLVFAQAGAHCIAPSDMMDGRIASIREELNKKQFHRTLIMSYASKFHSSYYGPFRAAADSAPKGGISLRDRSSYQIDPSNYRDALRSAQRDCEEGADILMVKPGLPYLDVLYRLSSEISLPWAVYEVSGEFAAIEILSEKGLIHAPQAHVENWKAFVRAGAQIIISYGARHAQKWIQEWSDR